MKVRICFGAMWLWMDTSSEIEDFGRWNRLIGFGMLYFGRQSEELVNRLKELIVELKKGGCFSFEVWFQLICIIVPIRSISIS